MGWVSVWPDIREDLFDGGGKTIPCASAVHAFAKVLPCSDSTRSHGGTQKCSTGYVE